MLIIREKLKNVQRSFYRYIVEQQIWEDVLFKDLQVGNIIRFKNFGVSRPEREFSNLDVFLVRGEPFERLGTGNCCEVEIFNIDFTNDNNTISINDITEKSPLNVEESPIYVLIKGVNYPVELSFNASGAIILIPKI